MTASLRLVKVVNSAIAIVDELLPLDGTDARLFDRAMVGCSLAVRLTAGESSSSRHSGAGERRLAHSISTAIAERAFSSE